ncbi:alpha-galactosidase [Tersicoccus solisilvae]|uniref:Alpha-galactosidase n=1 Tax=Tersicoccus solisilvae TaxID=1882339 RepID=A0ABQ1P7Y5_9MICC|nr:alpha-galactosidase [Tersicoccus solisilvae]GGC92469.1 alpha-galactosidase [Tersicoccus solisilvae]
MTPSRLVYLRAAGVSVLLDLPGTGDAGRAVPAFLHWGPDLGPTPPPAAAFTAPVTHSGWDEPATAPIVPAAADGWRGRPALRGSRAGTDYSPHWRVVSSRVDVAAEHDAAGAGTGGRVRLDLADEAAGLGLTWTLDLSVTGVVRVDAAVRNTGATPYQLAGLEVSLPVGPAARELMDLTGTWTRERHPQRLPFAQGAWVRAGRHGRTGHDAPTVLCAGEEGFAHRRGRVWAVHLAASGDTEVFAERLPDPSRRLGGGELLGPGEIELAPGEEYRTPTLFGACAEAGLDGVAAAFHRWVRGRPQHPATPRPVILNTWEAVYFRHDLAALTELADVAADIGVERFVLDDGWFGHRRDDTAGLGDWWVDPAVWPDGLGPLIDHVTGLGLEFGIWVEPEMVSPDSDLARAHPDWISGPGPGRTPASWRHQQVLDLVHPEAFAYVLGTLDALLTTYPIRYLKWDQNRDHTELGHGGRAAAHAQTAAGLALMAELKRRHPGLEIESCSSGGARVDLAVLEHTDRVWASDSNDALERQTIQQYTGLLLPPELIGAHIGPPTAHSSGRTHALGFRAVTALFGHLGLEWDIRRTGPRERDELRHVIGLYRRHRALLHGGTSVRADTPGTGLGIHGVVAPDAGAALYAVVATGTSPDAAPGPQPLPGLDPDGTYDVELVDPLHPGPADFHAPTDPAAGHGAEDHTLKEKRSPAWVPRLTGVSGAALANAGLTLPVLNPEQALLLHVRRTAPVSGAGAPGTVSA